MNSRSISRRKFAQIAGALAVAQTPVHGAASSAQEIVKQIQDGLGGNWPQTGIDGFKAGKPETEVRGIAVTAMATMAVLRKASKSGLNLIVTHEPTFFGSRDGAVSARPQQGGGGRGPATPAADDPVRKAKQEFVEKNGLVIFRLRDHWRARKENDMTAGLADSLGWAGRRVAGEAPLYDIPAATLSDTVAAIRKKLNLRGGLRAVGDPKAKVRRVMLYPGQMGLDTMLKYFDQVDLLVAGEAREWECAPYAVDMNDAGEKRSLVTIGRVASEDPGMRACAAWMKTVVKGVPVEWVSAGDPYWRAV
jgi:putative NIF3 family GTP cyclohydrolase 1 type 2